MKPVFSSLSVCNYNEIEYDDVTRTMKHNCLIIARQKLISSMTFYDVLWIYYKYIMFSNDYVQILFKYTEKWILIIQISKLLLNYWFMPCYLFEWMAEIMGIVNLILCERTNLKKARLVYIMKELINELWFDIFDVIFIVECLWCKSMKKDSMKENE